MSTNLYDKTHIGERWVDIGECLHGLDRISYLSLRLRHLDDAIGAKRIANVAQAIGTFGEQDAVFEYCSSQKLVT